jgi:hypothetical protein
MCDGARQLDDHGFNRLDARIGRELASLTGLTNRQAALALTMVIKYHRQLGNVVTDQLRALLIDPVQEAVA